MLRHKHYFQKSTAQNLCILSLILETVSVSLIYFRLSETICTYLTHSQDCLLPHISTFSRKCFLVWGKLFISPFLT